MPHPFHPFPIVSALAVFTSGIIISIVMFALMLFLGPLIVIAVVIVWATVILRIMTLFIMAKYRILTLEKDGVTYRVGIISQHTTSLPYSRISESGYNQSFAERLFGVGTLRIDTAGGSSMAIHIKDMRHRDLEKIIKKIKEKSGKRGSR